MTSCTASGQYVPMSASAYGMYTLPSTPMRRLMLYEIMPQVCDAA